MADEARRHNRPISNHLHPLVYLAAVGLGLWFVTAVWVAFSGYRDMELPLWVVSGFFLLMAVAIPSAIWLTWWRHADERGKSPPLRDWASGDFETAEGRRKAASAAVEMLLSIAAAAFGMTILGIVFYTAEASAMH